MSQFAAQTSVSPERTRAEIETILHRYKASQFIYGWQTERAMIGFELRGRVIRFELPLPDRKDRNLTHTKRRGYMVARTAEQFEAAYEQAVRQRWRALLLVIKAKLEAVESGISTLEEEFLAWIQLANGKTVGQVAIPQLNFSGGGLSLLPHKPNAEEVQPCSPKPS